MKTIFDSQELTRRFNEEEAVWQRFEQKRRLRRVVNSDPPLSDEILDELDWLHSERELRNTRFIGKALP